MVVPRFVKAAIENKNLEVYGDGKQSRVFCHVADAIDAVTKVLKMESTIGEVYNVGGVGEISILDLAKTVITQTKSNSSIDFVPYSNAYAPGYEDMQRRVPDINKISKLLNWAPSRNLETIIEDVEEGLR